MAYLRRTPFKSTAYVPQHSVHHEEMPQGMLFKKTRPLRTRRPSRKTAFAMRRCPKECLFEKQIL
jgi:hypothetical protein